MSVWQDNRVTERILEILSDVPDASSTHHFGRPFLTAYQIAIELNHRHPEVITALGYTNVGGLRTGTKVSLSQYLAQNLSRKMNSGHLDQVEGGFISNWHLEDMSFSDGGTTLHSSLTRTQYTLSAYRLRS